MTQQQLDRSVARRTGESVRFIHRRGFHLIVVPERAIVCDHGIGANTPTQQPISPVPTNDRLAS